MLNVDQARQQLLDAISPLEKTKTVKLQRALNRVLAAACVANINVPPADNSAMDGYAVHTGDIESVPCALPVSQRIAAGQSPAPLKRGTVARIFTGAEIPQGANAVVIQEDCDATDSGAIVKTTVRPGDNIRPNGQDIKQGSVLFEAGHRLRPQDLGLLASTGIAEVVVGRKPRVAVIGTGDELVEPGRPLARGQIYNSNKFLLNGLLQQLGCKVVYSGIVADTLDATVNALEHRAREADLVITTGGVSVGDEDHVKKAIETLGRLQLWKIHLKPGKPVAFGNIEGTPLLGLPGNPVSSFVTFLLFAVPVIQKLQGQAYQAPQKLPLPLKFAINRARGRPEFMRVRITDAGVERYPNQSSGVLASVAWANALAFIPDGKTFSEGDLVDVYPLNALLNGI